MCDAVKPAFGDPNDFTARGGMKTMSEALARGVVLVMSIWDDHAANMLWLDSTYPVTKTTPGGPRGSCATTSGAPKDVEAQHPDAHVLFSNVRWGEIGSTFAGSPTPPGPTPTPSGCPGGTITACMALCPSTPPVAFQDCAEECAKRCPGQIGKIDLDLIQ